MLKVPLGKHAGSAWFLVPETMAYSSQNPMTWGQVSNDIGCTTGILALSVSQSFFKVSMSSFITRYISKFWPSGNAMKCTHIVCHGLYVPISLGSIQVRRSNRQLRYGVSPSCFNFIEKEYQSP